MFGLYQKFPARYMRYVCIYFFENAELWWEFSQEFPERVDRHKPTHTLDLLLIEML